MCINRNGFGEKTVTLYSSVVGEDAGGREGRIKICLHLSGICAFRYLM